MGIEGQVVVVEVDLANGLPQFDIVGQPDAAAREARERVRSAIKNSGFEFPLKRLTVNLAPASIRKEGTCFDLAIAMGILVSSGQVPAPAVQGLLFMAELALDGSLRPVRGVLPVAFRASRCGISQLVVHRDNLAEARAASQIRSLTVGCLRELVDYLSGIGCSTGEDPIVFPEIASSGPVTDLCEIRGLARQKRVLEIAAAGGHHLLLIGPPGSGKTMLARALAGILPELNEQEALESSVIYSVAGLLPPGTGLLSRPPFRSPHHTVSLAGLLGSARGKPGEVSLAHNGVLFLDELPEFRRDALEAMRQPLEEHVVNLSRAAYRLTLPARFQLLGAMNPCPCGRHSASGESLCRCSPAEVRRYRQRVSGPILDRIDLQTEVPRQTWQEVEKAQDAENSSVVAARVAAARKLQAKRNSRLGQSASYLNACLSGDALRVACALEAQASALFSAAFDRLHLSMRAADKILRVARTIADLEGSERVRAPHIAEATGYRLDNFELT